MGSQRVVPAPQASEPFAPDAFYAEFRLHSFWTPRLEEAVVGTWAVLRVGFPTPDFHSLWTFKDLFWWVGRVQLLQRALRHLDEIGMEAYVESYNTWQYKRHEQVQWEWERWLPEGVQWYRLVTRDYVTPVEQIDWGAVHRRAEFGGQS